MNSIVQEEIVVSGIKKEIVVPGDKSITHRSIIFSSIASGKSTINTDVLGRDNLATIRIFQQLGVVIHLELNDLMAPLAMLEGIKNVSSSNSHNCQIIVEGKGLSGLTQSNSELDCGNSGTTGRLLCGLFSTLKFPVTLVGDESLSKRPFARVTKPLSLMGAKFSSDNLPIKIEGGNLKGISWDIPKASAQVKSALLIAGMFSDSKVVVSEPLKSRDHTEKMLSSMGAEIKSYKKDALFFCEIEPLVKSLDPLNLAIPGDISAAMFFIVIALLDPRGTGTLIKNVGINPTRNFCLEILRSMGGKIELENIRDISGEEVADIRVFKSDLKGISLNKDDVAKAIDEIPVISVAACFAKGRTVVTGAEELRVKESDRIVMTLACLSSFGVDCKELPDGMEINGPATRKLCDENDAWKACGDHRISMCGAVMEYLLNGSMKINDRKSIETSFPSFFECFS